MSYAAAAASEPSPRRLSLTASPSPLCSQMLGSIRRARVPRPTHALALDTAQRGDFESAGPRRCSGSTSWCDRRFEPSTGCGCSMAERLLDSRAPPHCPRSPTTLVPPPSALRSDAEILHERRGRATSPGSTSSWTPPDGHASLDLAAPRSQERPWSSPERRRAVRARGGALSRSIPHTGHVA